VRFASQPLLGLPLLLALWAARGALAEPPPEPPDLKEIGQQLDATERGVQTTEDHLLLVEKGFIEPLGHASVETLEDRFGKGELEFLLQDYVAASVLLYDVVLNPQFRASRHYFDGVFYLGESLYRQKDYLGAKRFLRDVIESGANGDHFVEALSSYLDIAARTGDFRDLDHYTQLAQSTGRLPAGVRYLLAKSLYGRTDLDRQDRLRRAVEAFSQVPPGNPYSLMAQYFVGVCRLEQGEVARAREVFAQIVRLPPGTAAPATDRQVRELSLLAIGRLDYEQGKYSEALDAYQEIPETSSVFYEALYEIAWSYVRKGEFENARKAVELILIGAPEDTLTPQANILKAHLLSKLGKYQEAQDAFAAVVAKYAPVRDQVEALLKEHADPAAYFDQLIAQKGKSFDVTALLPPLAQQWAGSQREVGEAQQVIADLHDGREGIREGREIVRRMERRMAGAGSLQAFPTLQAGYARASAVDAALLESDKQLITIEKALYRNYLPPGDQKELEEAEARRAQLDQRFAALPKTAEEVDARLSRREDQLKSLERELFRMSLAVQSERAQLVAIQQMQAPRPLTPGPAPAASPAQRAMDELRGLDEIDSQVSALVKQIRDDEALVSAAGSTSEQELRQAYAAELQRESAVLARIGSAAPADVSAEAQRIEADRQRIARLRDRTTAALEAIRRAAVAQSAVVKEKIAIESQNLENYHQEVALTQSSASGLVGQIAFASFGRVHQDFYRLVLRADVGIVDVAWTQKRDETERIQKLAGDEDRELRVLDDEFKEVLGEVR
jgi:tetratricopeptide (TPR) repeat protein